MSSIENLRKAIVDELAKEAPNWHLIEKWSRGEVDSDHSSVRFSVDAGHIQRLGQELVAKQETALAELIKNAYDADATKVTVKFIDQDTPGGTLVVEDNGVGMPFDVIRDSWMRLSTSHKQTNPVSKRFGRVRAGRKGIGRFAVQRLGESLVLETEVAGHVKGLRVRFNWDERFHAGDNLNDIFNSVEEYEKPLEREGTVLVIERLREAWSDTAIKRVWKMILTLQSPFAVLAPLNTSPDEPGFEVIVNGLSSRNQATAIGLHNGFLQHATAEISGKIDDNGIGHVNVTSSRFHLDDRYILDRKFKLTGPLEFNAKYFIYMPEVLSGLSVAVAREMGREYGGVRIYRNGFRVLPYGERSDDWLALDRDTSRRNIIVPANNVNFFGYVSLSQETNPLFEETSSREGLIENDAFEELRAFMRSSLEWAFLRVASARGRKQTTGQRDFISTARPRKPSEVIDSIAYAVEAATTSVETTDEIAESVKDEGFIAKENQFRPKAEPSYELKAAMYALEQAREEITLWEADVEQRQAASLEYEEMLRILASLGLSISVFGHEIKGIRGSVTAHLAVLRDQVEALPVDKKEDLLSIIEGLTSSTKRMFDLGGYVAGLMSNTESRELRTLSVKGALDRFKEQFKQYLERQKVTLEYSVFPENLRTAPMHGSEIDSVLLNFFTNSIKSIKKAKVSPRKIRVSATEDGELVVLRFEDNGIGIPAHVGDRVFDAFYTTTVTVDDDGLAGPGTGLGLKIVSDIANSYGGKVSVKTPSLGYTCCIEFCVRSDVHMES
ncbi:sensor histidine kinase [Massilia sp. UBA6681]|uniref:sensor histidine kinase n=1 Tax=Massilia sp. UBA6681 TaxID=1946839 RepID=UPI0025C60569|nr:ATP-binding protein [Massilia sp. UBA6681]